MINLSVLIFFILVPIIAGVLLLLNKLFAVRNPYPEKKTTYECGFLPIIDQIRTAGFQIAYFSQTLLFILIDVELVGYYPAASFINGFSIYGFVISGVFFTLLTVGLAYEYLNDIFQFGLSKTESNLDQDF